MPSPHAVFNEEEQKIAAEVLRGVSELAERDPSKGSWGLEHAIYRLVHGDANEKASALNYLSSRFWSGDWAQQLALALIQAVPANASDYIEVARKPGRKVSRSPQISRHLAPLASPENALVQLEGLGKKTEKTVALDWVERHPDYAARAWIAVALAKSAQLRTQAELGLRTLVARGHEPAVWAAVDRYGGEFRSAIKDILQSDSRKPPNSISFLQLESLPRLRLLDRAEFLPAEAVDILVKSLALSRLDAPHRILTEAQPSLDGEGLASWAWSLFEQWRSAGAPSQEDWALSALGLVGNDETASNLAPIILAWPGESRHQHAVMGLKVLSSIGTHVALMHLSGIAQRSKSKSLSRHAQQHFARVAREKNLTTEQLEDRVVPTCDLDLRGTATFDYGSRRFTVGFDEALKPYIEDQSGKRRSGLPKGGAQDSPELAAQNERRFKRLKKEVRTLASIQIRRLETAMVFHRRWVFDEFRRVLVEHPLMVRLVRRLVWGLSEDPSSVTSFRVGANSTFLDIEDNEFEPGDSASVTLVHPVDLTVDALAGWKQVFAAQAISQPLSQLDRPVHYLTEAEQNSTLLDRFCGQRFPVTKLLSLSNRGWVRGEAQDNGIVWWFSMPLPDGVHEARLLLGDDGFWPGMHTQQGDPSVRGIAFVPFDAEETATGTIPLGELALSLVSELVQTIQELVDGSKA